MKSKKQKETPKPEYPKVIETFYHVGNYEMGRMMVNEPSSFNGSVNIFKYRVTVDRVEEPKEVYQERLQKLWEECDNIHHYQPILSTAESLGIELSRDDYGKRRKPRR